jgi:hypothetical protein
MRDGFQQGTCAFSGPEGVDMDDYSNQNLDPEVSDLVCEMDYLNPDTPDGYENAQVDLVKLL